VEVFDNRGASALAKITRCDARDVIVQIDEVLSPANRSIDLIIASAVPKGERADWMIEKLSELGVTRFIPLLAERSVVEPGKNKLERWRRIAMESAKQSRRSGIMQIDALSAVILAVQKLTPSPGTPGEGVTPLYLSTAQDAQPI